MGRLLGGEENGVGSAVREIAQWLKALTSQTRGLESGSLNS